jgi:small conductance mechanosensitive channel
MAEATNTVTSTNLADNLINSATTKWDAVKHELENFVRDYWQPVLGAILIFIIGIMVSRWLAHLLRRWLERQQMEPPVRTLLVRVARLLMIIFTLLMSLDTLHVKITTLVAGIGVIGVGTGLALQGVLSNIVAGLTIIFTKPFRVGEYIEVSGVHGQVKAIDLSATVLTHSDLSTVVVPNKKIVGEILHNYGNVRQLHISVGVGYGSDMNRVLALARQIIETNPRVLKTPAPVVGITTLADSSITVMMRPWVVVPDYNAAQAEIFQAIIDRFRAEKIDIPFPQREVRMLKEQ